MRRTAFTTTVAALTTAGILLALSACSSRPDDSNDDGHDHVTLMRQTTHGVRWQLDAWESGQGLCLAVDGPGGPDDTLGSKGSGACTFSAPTKKNPDNSFWFAGTVPGSPEGTTGIAYGPVPPQTARVEVATHLTVPAVPLPAGHHLPRARVWWSIDTPGASTGQLLPNPRPITSSGRPLPLQAY
ncbi:hypothetical protein GA0115240_117736 [Streptomyces sp. DvalAA-14]|uniref:hypothetical protein n=1 Tax=unclassified Streptomyces TaxID=2593676 RepID=UPI00081AF48A|nr:MULTISPECIES: hypothetical protein [unclassified Streptomyces]MYS20239.1 hypothetical protein [Streptomyces sp. SID4948]SCD64153.1 hypothetical protein GA0115240_117736 [Streptomyces sp. DvalAA-14]